MVGVAWMAAKALVTWPAGSLLSTVADVSLIACTLFTVGA